MKKLIIEMSEQAYNEGNICGYFGCSSKKLDEVIYNARTLEDELGQIKSEIEDLDFHYDNDHWTSDGESMYKSKEVLAILDKHIENPLEETIGHWIDKEGNTAVCSCCNRNNVLYGDFCKWCGKRMKG